MPTVFELAEWEKIASVIYIVGSVLTIIAANETQRMEVQSQTSSEAASATQPASIPLTPTQLVVIISTIYVIGNSIFGLTAFSRLWQVEEGIQADTENASPEPNYYITFGWVLGIIGSILRLIGAQLRCAQEQPITIL